MTDRELAGRAQVLRYYHSADGISTMDPDDDGPWVAWTDYADLLAKYEELLSRAPSSEGDGIQQVEGLTVEREAGALSQSGERFPDLFVIRLGDREDCVIKGEQPALWAMFDAAIAAAEGETK